MTHTGHCHCGAVQFSVEGDPVRMAQCHCNACRRLTGTGHNVQAFFRKDQVTISGKTQTHASIADSGSDRLRHFCPVCGSRLFSENAKNPAGIGISVGVFDDSDWFKPQSIFYGAERPLWDETDNEVEVHDAM